MSEPDSKKSKLSPEDGQVFTFTKANEVGDRVLLVNDCIFHVTSENLIANSDYFRVMFTSDFMEKDKKEIEIKDVEVKEMKMFLTVLFQPESLNFKDKDVPLLCKVFSFFQAGDYLVQFLEENEAFKRFSVDDLIELGVEHGIPQMKAKIEEIHLNKLQETEIKSFQYEDFLEKAHRYGMVDLKAAIENYYIDQFKDDFVVDRLRIASRYELTNLEAHVEKFLLSELEKNQNIVDNYFIKHAMKNNGMPKLKEAVETMLLNQLETCLGENCNLIQRCCDFSEACSMNKLKDSTELFMLNKFKKGGYIQSYFIAICSRYLYEHDVPTLKTAVEQYLINHFETTHSLKNLKFAFCQLDGQNYFNNNSKKSFLQFRATMLEFLKTTTLDDPIMKAGYNHIIALSPGPMIRVFKTMLRKPDDEE